MSKASIDAASTPLQTPELQIVSSNLITLEEHFKSLAPCSL
jgi:hypothetical protein